MIALLLSAGLGALATWRWDAGWALPVYWYLAGITIALLGHDLRTRRLPNRLTLPAYPVLLVGLAAAALATHDPGRLVRAVAAGLLVSVVFAALHALNPTGLGAGDVKLAGALGIALGWVSWDAVLSGTVMALLLGAMIGFAVRRRRGPAAAFAFGPALLAGAWVAILA